MDFDGQFPGARAADPRTLERLFGTTDVLPLWIAEPYLPVSPAVQRALEQRTAINWFGYETRPRAPGDAFRQWMLRRHEWAIDDSAVLVSPSIGTSIAAVLDLATEPGDHVILQPPVFTDFKPLVNRSNREVARNSLILDNNRYTMDIEGLERVAAQPSTSAMILCNPHNPVGRVWTKDELTTVAQICDANDVFVISDEIHADIVLGEARFTPFAVAAQGSGVRSIALHGAIKTFGLAGVTDTLIVTDDTEFTSGFKELNSRFHLTRNNVFSIAAAAAAYTESDQWLDERLLLVAENARTLERDLPHPLGLISPEGTYLAWVDFRGLGLDVPALSAWLPHKARLALSPGHWFGREGAGFARMSIAVDPEVLAEAVDRLTTALG
jgi:cystathionine beta-lyase